MHPLDNAIDEVDDDERHPSLSWHSVGWLDLGWEGPRSGEDNDDEDDIEDWSDDAKHDMEDDDIISAYFLFFHSAHVYTLTQPTHNCDVTSYRSANLLTQPLSTQSF